MDSFFSVFGETSLTFIQSLFGTGIFYQIVKALLFVLFFILAGKILQIILIFINKGIRFRILNKVIEILTKFTFGISIVAGVYVGITKVISGISSSDNVTVRILDYTKDTLFIGIVIAFLIIAVRAVRLTVHHVITSVEEDKKKKFSSSLSILISRLTNTFVVFIGLVIVLGHFGQDISSLFTVLGAGTIIIGLAAQETLANMIAGFVIMIDQSYHVGDRIKIPSGEIGEVTDIGLRSTRVLDFDNNIIIIPNSELVKTRIINYSYPNPHVRVVVDFGVAYGSNVEQVKKIMLTIMQTHPKILKDPEPIVLLKNLGDSALEFTAVCRIDSFQEQFLVAENLRVSLYNALAEANIEIPFPQRVVHLKNQTDANPS